LARQNQLWCRRPAAATAASLAVRGIIIFGINSTYSHVHRHINRFSAEDDRKRFADVIPRGQVGGEQRGLLAITDGKPEWDGNELGSGNQPRAFAKGRQDAFRRGSGRNLRRGISEGLCFPWDQRMCVAVDQESVDEVRRLANGPAKSFNSRRRNNFVPVSIVGAASVSLVVETFSSHFGVGAFEFWSSKRLVALFFFSFTEW
jgi:hypothetical protein